MKLHLVNKIRRETGKKLSLVSLPEKYHKQAKEHIEHYYPTCPPLYLSMDIKDGFGVHGIDTNDELIHHIRFTENQYIYNVGNDTFYKIST